MGYQRAALAPGGRMGTLDLLGSCVECGLYLSRQRLGIATGFGRSLKGIDSAV